MNFPNYCHTFFDPSKIWGKLSDKPATKAPKDLIKSSSMLTAISGFVLELTKNILPTGKTRSGFERFSQTNLNQYLQNNLLETYPNDYLAVSQNGFPLRYLEKLSKLSKIKCSVAEECELDLVEKTRNEISTNMGQCKGMALLFTSMYLEMISAMPHLDDSEFEEHLKKMTSVFYEGNTKKGIVLSSLINDVDDSKIETIQVEERKQFESKGWNADAIDFLVDYKIIPVANKILGLVPTTKDLFSLSNAEETIQLLSGLESGCYLCFSLRHAMVVIKRNDQFYLFDPNIGLVRFFGFQEFKDLTAKYVDTPNEKDPDAMSLEFLKMVR